LLRRRPPPGVSLFNGRAEVALPVAWVGISIEKHCRCSRVDRVSSAREVEESGVAAPSALAAAVQPSHRSGRSPYPWIRLVRKGSAEADRRQACVSVL